MIKKFLLVAVILFCANVSSTYGQDIILEYDAEGRVYRLLSCRVSEYLEGSCLDKGSTIYKLDHLEMKGGEIFYLAVKNIDPFLTLVKLENSTVEIPNPDLGGVVSLLTSGFAIPVNAEPVISTKKIFEDLPQDSLQESPVEVTEKKKLTTQKNTGHATQIVKDLFYLRKAELYYLDSFDSAGSFALDSVKSRIKQIIDSYEQFKLTSDTTKGIDALMAKFDPALTFSKFKMRRDQLQNAQKKKEKWISGPIFIEENADLKLKFTLSPRSTTYDYSLFPQEHGAHTIKIKNKNQFELIVSTGVGVSSYQNDIYTLVETDGGFLPVRDRSQGRITFANSIHALWRIRNTKTYTGIFIGPHLTFDRKINYTIGTGGSLGILDNKVMLNLGINIGSREIYEPTDDFLFESASSEIPFKNKLGLGGFVSINYRIQKL